MIRKLLLDLKRRWCKHTWRPAVAEIGEDVCRKNVPCKYCDNCGTNRSLDDQRILRPVRTDAMVRSK